MEARSESQDRRVGFKIPCGRLRKPGESPGGACRARGRGYSCAAQTLTPPSPEGEGVIPPRDHGRLRDNNPELSTFNLEPVTAPRGNGPARTFRIPGALGTVGFISPLGEHFCESCNRLRLTSDGKLRSCLVSPNEVSLRDAVRSQQPLERYFHQAIANKPQHHNMLVAMPVETQRGMSQIGG